MAEIEVAGVQTLVTALRPVALILSLAAGTAHAAPAGRCVVTGEAVALSGVICGTNAGRIAACSWVGPRTTER